MLSDLHKSRLETLALHLLYSDKLSVNEFFFGKWREEVNIAADNEPAMCHTAGCAGGECPYLWPDEWEWKDLGNYKIPRLIGTGYGVGNSCVMFFGITEEEFNFLFMPSAHNRFAHIAPWNTKHLYMDASRREVGEAILRFIEWKNGKEKNEEIHEEITTADPATVGC